MDGRIVEDKISALVEHTWERSKLDTKYTGLFILEHLW
jgi:hypothetical protein